MKFESAEFFPTPVKLLDKITDGLDWRMVNSVLEPSAGRGDMAQYVMEQYEKVMRDKKLDLDCIELDRELQNVLKGYGYRVVHDDFMTFHTFKKYSLIIMNPPFSAGAAHLTKALDMQKDGGGVICILNAETIRNPYTNERKTLVRRLTELGADIRCFLPDTVKKLTGKWSRKNRLLLMISRARKVMGKRFPKRRILFMTLDQPFPCWGMDNIPNESAIIGGERSLVWKNWHCYM